MGLLSLGEPVSNSFNDPQAKKSIMQAKISAFILLLTAFASVGMVSAVPVMDV
jgi:hypothetical protein